MQVLDVITARRPGPILTVALVALATAALLAQPSQSLLNRAGSVKFAAIGDNGTGDRSAL